MINLEVHHSGSAGDPRGSAPASARMVVAATVVPAVAGLVTVSVNTLSVRYRSSLLDHRGASRASDQAAQPTGI
jgi:hypothetical protein